MDITQELPKKIWIDNGGHGFFQLVSYEDTPKYCRDCQKSGHITGKCNTTDDVFLKKDAATSTKANYKDPKPSRDTGCPIPKETKATVQNSKANEDVLVTPLEQQEIAKEDMARWGSVAEGTTPTTRGNDTSVQSSKNRSANIKKIPSLEGSSSIQPTAQLEVEEAIVGTLNKADVVEIENAVTLVADAIEIHDGCSTPTLVFEDGMTKPNKTQAAKISPDPQTAIEAKATTRHTYKETIIEVDGQLFIIEVKEQDDFKTTEKPLEVTKDATSAGSKDEEPQEFAANDTFDASQDNEETRNQTELEFDCEEYHLQTLQTNNKWVVGGDFNIIAEWSEHKGKTMPNQTDMTEFKDCIATCNLNHPHTQGSIFTWSGGRRNGIVFRRLDRALVNETVLQYFDDVCVKHLSKSTSDHKPVLLTCFKEELGGPKPFRFIDAWALHPSFLKVVNEYWKSTHPYGGMAGLSSKLRGLKGVLTVWNKSTFGNIFSNLKEAEEQAISAQEAYEQDPNPSNREADNKGRAHLIQATNIELLFWKQKANLKWISEGDCNSKFYHAYVKGRRAKAKIRCIYDQAGKEHRDMENISRRAIDHFTNVFSNTQSIQVEPMMDYLEEVITAEDNERICKLPFEEEIRAAVWSLDPGSAPGPDGFNGTFYRTCWNIIKTDVISATQEFFTGVPIPKAYGSTFITLIPKNEKPRVFGDFRPISLSTFMSKINTRILANRIQAILPKIISAEQTGFQKGMGVEEQILLVEEMVHKIDSKVRGAEREVEVQTETEIPYPKENEVGEQRDAEAPPEMRRETETQQNQEEQREPEERHPATAPSAVSLPIRRKFTPQTYPVFTESWAGFSRGLRSLQASHWTIQANLEKMRVSVQEPAIPRARPDLLALNALHLMEQAQQSLLTLTEEYLGGASGNYRAVVLLKEKELVARALQQKVDSVEQQVQVLQEENARLKADCSMELADEKSKVQSLQEQIAIYQEGTRDLEAQFDRLQAQISILESRASASEDKVGNLEAGLVEKESRISELENSLQEAKHEGSRSNEFALKQMEARRLILEKLKEER
ncbi:unnamed protein product [Cuscuta campestris]|uniref:Endonuclease/exonuclease/phosphatase domain-containing protein n=1 Tax=Cuscuta campestris TaxID=132261 RepID=A0A484MYI7_9ASTE|nr:unnamed protein product [Cuscuta campestris]